MTERCWFERMASNPRRRIGEMKGCKRSDTGFEENTPTVGHEHHRTDVSDACGANELDAAFQNADIRFCSHALNDIHYLGWRLLAQPVRAKPALRARYGHAGAEAGVEVELVQELGLVLCQLLRAKLRLDLLQGCTIRGVV